MSTQSILLLLDLKTRWPNLLASTLAYCPLSELLSDTPIAAADGALTATEPEQPLLVRIARSGIASGAIPWARRLAAPDAVVAFQLACRGASVALLAAIADAAGAEFGTPWPPALAGALVANNADVANWLRRSFDLETVAAVAVSCGHRARSP